MDVFERVREVNRGADLNEVRIAAARARLVSGIDSGMSAERKRIARRPMFLIAGAVAGVAAATAGVVVISQMTTPTPQVEAIPTATATPKPQPTPIPEPSATSGTGVTEPFPGTTPQAGQYLRILTTEDRLLYRGPEVQINEWIGLPGTFPPISAAIVRSMNQLFVPGDRTGEWINRSGPAGDKVQFFPEDQGPAGKLAWDNMLPYRPDVEQWSVTGGLDGEGGPARGSLEDYARYPKDPQALIQHLRAVVAEWAPSDEVVDEVVALTIVDVLVSNFAPSIERATFLEALALTGRTEMLSSNGSIVTYRLRYSASSDPGRTETVSIDTTTGWVTEFTMRYDRNHGAEGDMAPSDIPDIRRTFTVTIVDSVQ